ncbi:hypothetical protein ACQCX2_07635 [Propionibacteriaceae bacterium Y1700]|uniref:hypothetical protein n=1 Tax=Microlunatus sp. Y1700 TaxID=3418487 RepID=UPI003DA7892D
MTTATLRRDEWIEGNMVVRTCHRCYGAGEVAGRDRDPLSGYRDPAPCTRCVDGVEFVRMLP